MTTAGGRFDGTGGAPLFQLNHCSTASPDGPIGTTAAKLTTGTCDSNDPSYTCTTDQYGVTICDCNSGVYYGCDPATGCASTDGGAIDYGFCAFTSIGGNFVGAGYGTNGVDPSTAEIYPSSSDGKWHIHVKYENSTDYMQASWVCARQSDFSPSGTFGPPVKYSVNTNHANPDTLNIPSSGYYVCPWTAMMGKCDGSAGVVEHNKFGATPGGGTTQLNVYGDRYTGKLEADSYCTSTGTQQMRYGVGHPGSTSGWSYTSTGTERDVGLTSTSRAVCYLTEWDNQELQTVGGSQDHVWLYQSGGFWFLTKNHDYISVTVTCLPYDQSP